MRTILRQFYSKLILIPIIGYVLQVMLSLLKLPRSKKYLYGQIRILNSKMNEMKSWIDDNFYHCNEKHNQLLNISTNNLNSNQSKIGILEERIKKIEDIMPELENMLTSSASSLRFLKRELSDLKRKEMTEV